MPERDETFSKLLEKLKSIDNTKWKSRIDERTVADTLRYTKINEFEVTVCILGDQYLIEVTHPEVGYIDSFLEDQEAISLLYHRIIPESPLKEEVYRRFQQAIQ